jgi:sugar/nucleoside kinase (ribokinase family)
MTHPELATYLRENESKLASLPVVTGFDGFVDEMISVVDERTSLTEFKRVETIADFGEKVSAAAGHSSLREIVVNQADPGGCAINMGDGLASFGLPVTTFATVGEPMHAAFAEYAKKAEVISWGDEPGRTLAYEFADGKLMFSAVSQLQNFKPETLKGYLADGRFAEAYARAKLFAITDWTLYPHMTDSWNFLIDEVLSKVNEGPELFFDLVDPSGRSAADMLEMQDALKRFAGIGEVTLGLNQNEANILCRLNEIEPLVAEEPESAMQQGRALIQHLGIHQVVIHSVKYATGASAAGDTFVYGPYCEKPVKSTGAGDRFNAGYALGCVLDLPMQDRLTLATASSGFFVRSGYSASTSQLAEFLVNWC